MSQSSPHGQSQNPLPAGEILNEAFQFAMRRWGTVLRYAWLPLAIGGFILYACRVLLFGDADVVDGGKGASFLRVPVFFAVVVGVGAFVACAFLYAGVMTSLFRLVATGEERGGFAHLRTDEPVFRVFWAVLIVNGLGIAVLAFSLLLGFVSTGNAPGEVLSAFSEYVRLAVDANARGETIPVEAAERLAEPLGVVFLCSFAAMLVIIYLNIRLTPFAAGSAVENRLLLFGAFHLTRGRFWPIFFVQVLIFLCVFALSLIVDLGRAIIAMLGTLLTELGGIASLGGGAVLMIAFLIAVAFQLFSASIQLSAQGIIYRRLKTGE